MNVLNQFSYVLFGAGALAVSFVVLRRQIRARWSLVMLAQVVIAAAFAVGFVLLRPGAGNVSDFEAAQSAIGNGRPTFIAFFSNYCTGCITVEPTVDRIAAEIDGEFDVLRVDIHTEVGRAMRAAYGFSFTPEFVLYDGEGQEIWRDHTPPSQVQIDLARGID